jgi:hypothetical protein
MSKKHSVLRDELNLKGGGLYCYMPFENLDKSKKAVFKIGLAIDFNHRLENYHTYFPLGVYMVAFLEKPPIPMALRGKKIETMKSYYLKIEKFIFQYMKSKGAKQIHATTRSNLAGQTEWFYSDVAIIHESFTAAKKQFGGNIHLFNLDGINQIGKQNEKTKPNYVGKIVFVT